MKTCLCCGYKTLEDKSMYDICPICFWEDDPVNYGKADYKGGSNGFISLREAQKNFLLFGACDEKCVDHVRKVDICDEKDELWRPY